ncbi:MAG: DUF2235 domain-containing protein [Litorimonas sp.]
MKRIIICFDGTWNKIDAKEPTNVLMMATGLTPKTAITAKSKLSVTQIIHYDEGIGTHGGWIRRHIDGMFGLGVLKNMQEAYRFLMFNYDPQDEVYVFGFSRGAFTARSFVGLVRSVGIIQRDHVKNVTEGIRLYKKGLKFDDPKMLSFRALHSRHISTCGEDETHRCDLPDYLKGSSLPFKFRYVGLWDTVESIGFWKIVWASLMKRKQKAFVDSDHKYHDHKLNGMITAGRHAVALDERRPHFHSEPWGKVADANDRLGFKDTDPKRPIQEMFFPGNHGSVGGGGDVRGLSDGAFDWILDGAKEAGLELDTSPTSSVFSVLPDYQDSLRNSTTPPKKFSIMNMLAQTRNHKPKGLHQLHESVKRRWKHGGHNGETYRSKTLTHLSEALDKLDFAPPLKQKQVRGKTEASKSEKAFTYHTIVKGETLGKIAKRELGDPKRYKEIFELNTGTLHNPDKIYPGQVIRIPVDETETN